MTKKPIYTVEELQARIAAGSQNHDDYFCLADLLVDIGHFDEAESCYQRALEFSRTNLQKARTSMELGWLFYETRRESEALPLAQNAIQLLLEEPDHVNVSACRGASRSLLAHCLWLTDENAAIHRARSSLEELSKIIAESPEFERISEVYYDAARVQILLRNTQEAIKLCEKCLSVDLRQQEKLSCLYVYSEALRQEGRLADAERCLNEILRQTEMGKASLYLSLGSIQRSMDRPIEAGESFYKALESLPADPYLRDNRSFLTEIHRNLGQVHYLQRDYRIAAEMFTKAIASCSPSEPVYCNLLLWLGHSCEGEGNIPKAQECYEELLSLDRATADEKRSAQEALSRLPFKKTIH